MIKEWIPACAGMTERWYGFLMQFTPAKLVPAKAGSRGRNDRKMVWIPDAVYPCEACPCESRE